MNIEQLDPEKIILFGSYTYTDSVKKHNFTKIEDIMKVRGIGKKLFEKIKSEIEVKK